MNKLLTVLLGLISFSLFTFSAAAAPPQTMSYQASLKDAAGLPIDATENITFRIYDALTGGTLLWTDTQSVTVDDGLLSVELGTLINPLPISSMDMPLWLGVEIASDGEAVPRAALHSVNNAFRAEDADSIGGKTLSELQERVNGSCAAGLSIREIAADGTVTCEDDTDTTYSGSDFATSSQSCMAGQVATGVNSTGIVTCAVDADTTYSGSDFAASNQSCSAGQVVTGVSSAGVVTCAVDANSGGDITTVGIGGGLAGGGSSGAVTISHLDTSSQSSVNNSNGVVVQDITLDTYGHSTAISSYNLDSRYFTETESNSNFVNSTGDVMSGPLTVEANVNVTAFVYGQRFYDVNNNGYYLDPNLTSYLNIVRVNRLYDIQNIAYYLEPGSTSNLSTLASEKIGIGDLTPDYLLDIEGGASTYLMHIDNDNASGSTYGSYVEADGRDSGTKHAYGATVIARGGTTSGLAYGSQNIAYANGTSTAYAVYGDATGGSTSGEEYAFYGVGEGYFSRDLEVDGTVNMGFESVSGSATGLSSQSSCSLTDTGTCYYATANASCPTGKIAIAGGCNCSSSYNCYIIDSHRNSGTSWRCRAAASATGYLVTPSVSCARIGN